MYNCDDQSYLHIFLCSAIQLNSTSRDFKRAKRGARKPVSGSRSVGTDRKEARDERRAGSGSERGRDGRTEM